MKATHPPQTNGQKTAQTTESISNKADLLVSKRPANPAHAVALALHRDGYSVGHGVIAGVTLPRIIRAHTLARRAS